MFEFLQVLSVVLLAVGMGLSLAHALELPGKLRLNEETYLAVQTIYYPGFTIGGLFGEFGAMLATLILLLVIPSDGLTFWLTLIALALLLIAHAAFWVVIQPVNKIWLKEQKLGNAGTAFFSAGGNTRGYSNWKSLRTRWEAGHVARAILALLSLTALTSAVAA